MMTFIDFRIQYLKPKRILFSLCSAAMVLTFAACTAVPTSQTQSKTKHQTKISERHKSYPAMSETLNALIGESLLASPNETMRELTEEIRENPTNPDTLYAVGYSHMQSSQSGKNKTQHDLAIRYFNEALKLVPGNASLLRALYNIYYEDTAHNRNPNAFESARTIFYQLTEAQRKDLNPPSLAKYVIMEAWFENQKQMNRPVLRRLLLDAMREQLANETVILLLARQYNDDKYFSMAIATLKFGLENLPNNAELYKAIAQTYEDKQDSRPCSYDFPREIEGAAKYYKLAIAQSADEHTLHLGLSRALLDQNLVQLALNEADIAVSIDDSEATISATAERYSMLGRAEKSQVLLKQALDKGYKISDPGYHEMMMNQGDWQKAYKGFSAYVKARKNYSVYDLIKNDIIAQQANQIPISLDKKPLLNTSWEEKLYAYWSKKISDAELKSSASNRCEKTEYFFYTGYQDFSAGKFAVAKSKFTDAINQNTFRFIERPLARYFLTR